MNMMKAKACNLSTGSRLEIYWIPKPLAVIICCLPVTLMESSQTPLFNTVSRILTTGKSQEVGLPGR